MKKRALLTALLISASGFLFAEASDPAAINLQQAGTKQAPIFKCLKKNDDGKSKIIAIGQFDRGRSAYVADEKGDIYKVTPFLSKKIASGYSDVKDISRGRDGDFFFIAGDNVYKFMNGTATDISGKLEGNPRLLCADANGNMFCATDKGLFKISNGSDWTLVNDLEGKKIKSLEYDGTYGGFKIVTELGELFGYKDSTLKPLGKSVNIEEVLSGKSAQDRLTGKNYTVSGKNLLGSDSDVIFTAPEEITSVSALDNIQMMGLANGELYTSPLADPSPLTISASYVSGVPVSSPSADTSRIGDAIYNITINGSGLNEQQLFESGYNKISYTITAQPGTPPTPPIPTPPVSDDPKDSEVSINMVLHKRELDSAPYFTWDYTNNSTSGHIRSVQIKVKGLLSNPTGSTGAIGTSNAYIDSETGYTIWNTELQNPVGPGETIELIPDMGYGNNEVISYDQMNLSFNHHADNLSMVNTATDPQYTTTAYPLTGFVYTSDGGANATLNPNQITFQWIGPASTGDSTVTVTQTAVDNNGNTQTIGSSVSTSLPAASGIVESGTTYTLTVDYPNGATIYGNGVCALPIVVTVNTTSNNKNTPLPNTDPSYNAITFWGTNTSSAVNWNDGLIGANPFLADQSYCAILPPSSVELDNGQFVKYGTLAPSGNSQYGKLFYIMVNNNPTSGVPRSGYVPVVGLSLQTPTGAFQFMGSMAGKGNNITTTVVNTATNFSSTMALYSEPF